MEPNTLSLSRTSSTTRDGDTDKHGCNDLPAIASTGQRSPARDYNRPSDSTVGIEAESFIVSANDRQI
jgi:hypothetical protein